MISLVAIVKEERNLVEWCEYHKGIGFDRIFLYLNDWLPDYDLPEGVTTEVIHGKAKQLAAYNKWLQDYQHFYTHAAFFDADEYLYLAKWANVTEMLRQLGWDKHTVINWVFFGSQQVPKNEGIVRRFRMRASTIDKHVKCIVRLNQGAYMTGPHNCSQLAYSPEHRPVLGPFNPKGKMDNAFIAHYWTQDLEYFRVKCARGRADTGDKFNHKVQEWHEQNVITNEVYDDRLVLNYYNFINHESE
jgi:hypothetical protein